MSVAGLLFLWYNADDWLLLLVACLQSGWLRGGQDAMSFDGWMLLQWLAYVIMGVGVLGALLPVLPGPVLIWLGVLLWAWADHFQRIGWPVLTILALLMLSAAGSEVWMSALGARRAGASWQALLAGAASGIAGFVIFSLPGAIVGVMAGILIMEAFRRGGLRPALKSGGGFLLGYLLAAVVQLSLSLIMIGVFAWQAMGKP